MASDLTSPTPEQTPELTDLELVEALKDCDTAALSRLYDRYSGLIYGLALRILKVPEEAEDVTQEVFLKLWQKAGLYNPNRGSVSSFLVTMARSRAIDKLRSRGSRFRFLQRWQTSTVHNIGGEAPLESVSRQERAQVVHSALKNLSDKERRVLEFSYYEGLSYSETAQRLELPLGTVKSRARTGLHKLRHALKHSL
ncbi:MAG: sigma-70 family RNA polymerase sigma factor [Synechococcus sp.]